MTYRPNRDPLPDTASPGPSPKAVHFTLRILLRWVVPVLLMTLWTALQAPAGRVSPGASIVLVAAVALFFSGDFLARRLTAAVAPTYACPGCDSVFEAVGRWSCACGYHDHRDCHVILFRCPMCGARPGYTNCRRCDATIFLQSGVRQRENG